MEPTSIVDQQYCKFALLNPAKANLRFNMGPRQWVDTNKDLMRTRERILNEGRPIRTNLEEHCCGVQRIRKVPSHRLVSGHGGSCYPRRWVAPSLIFVHSSSPCNHAGAGGCTRPL
ncbi:hypothetical protein FOZ63_012690, partial [Perkinsus olseni]